MTQQQLPDNALYTPITEDLLQYITQRIVTACRPEKIILFGSYAYGVPQSDSDVDLLVVMNSRKSVFARHKQISNLFPQRLFALDILVKTPAEIAYRLKIQDPFFQKILTQGRVLYERGKRQRMDSQSRRRLRKRTTARAPAQKNLG
ncbi:MAG: nucleotidyltransferase domain-containing protein [Anaerolineae bacterium]|nr:nucleotidyltransferase domain-containing protein [Anaerolineae bacterium]